MTTVPIEYEPSWSKTGCQVVPSLSVRQTPPDATPIKYWLLLCGFTAIETTRPEINAGPTERNFNPLKVPLDMGSRDSALSSSFLSFLSLSAASLSLSFPPLSASLSFAALSFALLSDAADWLLAADALSAGLTLLADDGDDVFVSPPCAAATLCTRTHERMATSRRMAYLRIVMNDLRLDAVDWPRVGRAPDSKTGQPSRVGRNRAGTTQLTITNRRQKDSCQKKCFASGRGNPA